MRMRKVEKIVPTWVEGIGKNQFVKGGIGGEVDR